MERSGGRAGLPSPVDGSRWSRVIIRPASPLPSGTNFIKLEFPSTESPESRLTGENWVGGTEMDGLYGISGMQLHPVDETLKAKKSWFMFDNEIVSLGSDITGGDGHTVESIVENRKLNAAGDNALTVNGTVKPSSLGWSESLPGTNWIHLAGNGSGSDVGYYFPGGADLKALREARTGSPAENSHSGGEDTTAYTRNYAAFWYDHGRSPGADGSPAGSYAYTILPNRAPDEVKAYADAPDIEVVENTADAQAVRETTLNLLGINFWKDQIKQVGTVKVNRKASVMMKENGDQTLEVSISDPTQANSGTIDMEIAKAANPNSGWLSDPAISVYQTSPTIRFQVNVNGAKGQTFKAKFNLGSDVWPQQPPAPEPPKEPASFTDELNDFSRVFSLSDKASLLFDTGNPAFFANDSSRVKRFGTDVPQSLVYQVNEPVTFSARLHYRNGFADKIKAYASPDNRTWTAVALTPDTPVKNTDNDWYRANFSPAGPLPKGTRYIKIELGNDPLVYSPQLGAVTFTKSPISYVLADDLNDWSKAYKHSLSWDFDSAQADTRFEGDYSRLRASSEGQFIEYKAEEIIGFKVKGFANASSLDGLLNVEVSADEQNWTPVPLTIDEPVPTEDGINKFTVLSDGMLPEGSLFLRVRLAKSDPVRTVELGSLALEFGAFTDPLDTFDNMLSHGANLMFEKNSSAFEGDLSLLKRSGTDVPGELVYYYPNISDFAVQAYARDGFAGKVSVYASRDGKQWKAVALTNDPITTTSSGWNKTTFRGGQKLDPGNAYLKLVLSNDARVYSPMISRLTLYRTLDPDGPLPDPVVGPAVIVDPLDDWSESDSHTTGWQFDSSNAPLFGGDTGRLKRSSDTAQSVIYRAPNLVDFQVTVYPCVEPPAHPLELDKQAALFISSDGKAWAPVAYTATEPVGTSCWKKINVKPKDDLPVGTQYVKIELDHDSRVYAPQLAEVQLMSDGAISKRITGFSLGEAQNGEAQIDLSSRTVTVHVKAGTDMRSLAPALTTSEKTTAVPSSGSVQDFTKPVMYKVTAADKTSVNWTVQVILDSDSVPPVTTVQMTGERGSDNWYVTPVSVGLMAKDEASGVDYTEYRLDGSEWTRYEDAVTVEADGAHTLDYRSIDKAGNVEAERQEAFRMDRTAPVIDLASVKDSYNEGESLTVTHAAYDAVSGLQSVLVQLNGRDIMQDTPVLLTKPGLNEIRITAADAAGHTITQTKSFEVWVLGTASATPETITINNGVFTIRVDLPDVYKGTGVKTEDIRVNGSVIPESVKVKEDADHLELTLKIRRESLTLPAGLQSLEVTGWFETEEPVRFHAAAPVTIQVDRKNIPITDMER
ncbi:polysaccharide lyase beta-sandwich domain-containing protein [Paenibacillus sp. CC-CFT747]|nr:polysaccharide lyase beta-sandwich domain-containing protein [Paenibacillus sp. CC-CFT747]